MTPVILLLIATIADIGTTLFGLGVGALEANPLAVHSGWVFLLSWKLAITLFVAFVLHKMSKRLGRLAFIPGLVVAAIVIWNILNVLIQIRTL
jgi:Domain of unknown function (DUF5658)